MEHIYLLCEREFIKTNEPIYKIGKTKQQLNDRFKGYPKSSEIILTIKVNKCDHSESQIGKLFDSKFKNGRDIGREYYEGDVNVMKKELVTLCDHDTDKYLEPDDSDEDYCHLCQSKGSCDCCDYCRNTGRTYWSNGISGPCLMCDRGGDINDPNNPIQCQDGM